MIDGGEDLFLVFHMIHLFQFNHSCNIHNLQRVIITLFLLPHEDDPTKCPCPWNKSSVKLETCYWRLFGKTWYNLVKGRERNSIDVSFTWNTIKEMIVFEFSPRCTHSYAITSVVSAGKLHIHTIYIYILRPLFTLWKVFVHASIFWRHY